MLAAADKEFERVQHTEIYLSGLKLQYKTKFKLPLDTISKHVFSYLQLPDYPPPQLTLTALVPTFLFLSIVVTLFSSFNDFDM